MAAMVLGASEWHPGEEAIQRRLRVPSRSNPTNHYLPSAVTYFLSSCPVIVLGTLSRDGAPWVSLLGGEPGFVMGVGEGLIAIRSNLGIGDPILENLKPWKGFSEEEGIRNGEGMVAGLGVDFDKRRRIKFFGRAGRGMTAIELSETKSGENSIGILLHVEETIGECPKYITRRKLHYTTSTPVVHPSPLPLPQSALDVIAQADIFFVASRNGFLNMDTNLRGGPAGFFRVLHNDGGRGTVLVWPEYSGNRLYQTLGNFHTNPLAGVTIPNFTNGDVLYLTGTVEILFDSDADQMIPRSNLAVKLTVTAARFVQGGIGIRGEAGEVSPYNPPVRFLATERPDPLALAKASSGPPLRVRLTGVKKLTPTLARFTFRLLGGNTVAWKAGQFVALSFKEELSAGYRHMNDDDPTSLNDDYARTFTVSSPPPLEDGKKKSGEFELTIQKVGVVTEFLFRLTPRDGLEVPVLGFGGEFFIDRSRRVKFVAGGVGVTPFLAQFPTFSAGEKAGVELLWSVRVADLDFVKSMLSPAAAAAGMAGLAGVTSVFITGGDRVKLAAHVNVLKGWGVKNVYVRRLESGDLLKGDEGDSKGLTWYLCASKGLRQQVLKWLDGVEVVWEDFGF